MKLAEAFVFDGGVIFEHTNATTITPGEPNIITTDKGQLKADVVIQASGEPFWHSEMFDGRMWMKMSYALAVELEDPTEYPKECTSRRTIRCAPSARLSMTADRCWCSAARVMSTMRPPMTRVSHYISLAEDVQRRFKVKRIHCRWLAGDFMPYDRIPFIGPDPEYPSIYVITGYRAWGLTWAMAAAHGILSYIDGAPADLAQALQSRTA